MRIDDEFTEKGPRYCARVSTCPIPHAGVCGSCAAHIGGKPVLACQLSDCPVGTAIDFDVGRAARRRRALGGSSERIEAWIPEERKD
jgi:hypothetical protein